MTLKPKLLFILAHKKRFEVWRYYVMTCQVNKRLVGTYDTIEEAREKHSGAVVW